MERAAQEVCPLYELHTAWQILQVILICFSLHPEGENDHLIIRIKNNLTNWESHMSAVWLVVRFVAARMQLRQRCYLVFYWMDSTWWRTMCLHQSRAAWKLCLSLHREVCGILGCSSGWFCPRVAKEGWKRGWEPSVQLGRQSICWKHSVLNYSQFVWLLGSFLLEAGRWLWSCPHAGPVSHLWETQIGGTVWGACFDLMGIWKNRKLGKTQGLVTKMQLPAFTLGK